MAGRAVDPLNAMVKGGHDERPGQGVAGGEQREFCQNDVGEQGVNPALTAISQSPPELSEGFDRQGRLCHTHVVKRE